MSRMHRAGLRVAAHARGFSYTEVLVAMALIALLLVPAIDALYSGVQGSAVHATEAVRQLRLVDRLEAVLARPFVELEQAAAAAGGPTVPVGAYSDPTGSTDRCLVYIARYDADDADADGDPFSGADPDLLWIRVAIAGTPHRLETLTAR